MTWKNEIQIHNLCVRFVCFHAFRRECDVWLVGYVCDHVTVNKVVSVTFGGRRPGKGCSISSMKFPISVLYTGWPKMAPFLYALTYSITSPKYKMRGLQ